jgi:hypothetical protein
MRIKEKDKDKEILMELYDILENILSIIHGEREMRANIQSDIRSPSSQFPSNISKKNLSDLIFMKGMIVQSKFNHDRIPSFNLQ